MRKFITVSILLILVLTLVACNNQSVQSPNEKPEITIVVKTDLPAVTDATDSPYPISDNDQPMGTIYPVGQEPTPLPGSEPTIGPTSEIQGVPEADPEKAAVYGVLYSYTDKAALTGVKIYAADVVIVETSGNKIYTTQEKSSPQDDTDDRGQFTITSIKPGLYIFMMVTPFGNYPLFDSNNQIFELELKAGDVIDFGEAFVNWP